MKTQRSRLVTAATALLALVSGTPAAAQTPPSGVLAKYVDAREGLSIDALVAQSHETPSLQAMRARIAIAEGERRQAALRPNPTVGLERREQFGGLDNQTVLSVAWPLDLFRRGPRVTVATHDVRSATYVADDEERRHAAMVRERASDLLAAVRQLDVMARIAQASRERLELIGSRVDAGAAPPLERDLADVEWRRSQADVITWQSMADRALISLKALVGLGADAPLRLAAPLEEVAGSLTPMPAENPDSAIATRPDIKALDEDVARASAARARAVSEGRVDLSVTGGYMRRVAGVSPAREGMNEVMVGVMVDLPWRNRQQGAIAAADASRRAADALAVAGRLDVRAEIDAARVRDAAAARVIAQFRDGLLALAERNLTVVRESWQLGRGTLFDVIDEERRYLALQSDYTAALREVVDARTALLAAWGAGR